MGYESIAHEGERNSCFSKIHSQIVGQKYRNKTTLANKTRFSHFGFQSQRFLLQVGYNKIIA